jgi:hypothetical protein
VARSAGEIPLYGRRRGGAADGVVRHNTTFYSNGAPKVAQSNVINFNFQLNILANHPAPAGHPSIEGNYLAFRAIAYQSFMF